MEHLLTEPIFSMALCFHPLSIPFSFAIGLLLFRFTYLVAMAVPQVDKKMLGELEAMGFPTVRSIRALHFSGTIQTNLLGTDLVGRWFSLPKIY
jgi:hypothetical protein